MAGKKAVVYMFKACQKDMPPTPNTVFKVSVKLHSSVALWVEIIPHPGRVGLQTEAEKRH